MLTKVPHKYQRKVPEKLKIKKKEAAAEISNKLYTKDKVQWML